MFVPAEMVLFLAEKRIALWLIKAETVGPESSRRCCWSLEPVGKAGHPAALCCAHHRRFRGHRRGSIARLLNASPPRYECGNTLAERLIVRAISGQEPLLLKMRPDRQVERAPDRSGKVKLVPDAAPQKEMDAGVKRMSDISVQPGEVEWLICIILAGAG